MPAVNSQIVRSDYNAIRAKVVSVLGVGSGNTGWGQTARIRSSDVATGQKVTINEWANLRIDIINAYRQIAGSDPTTAQVIEGGTIRYSSTFTPDTGTLDVPQKQYDDWINDVIANRFTIGTGRASTTATQTSTKTDAWNGNISCTIGFYWNTADEARYFFNSGGTIRVSSSRTGGTVSAQNTSWESLLSSVGTVNFGANTPGTGTTPSDGTNWYRLTNSFQTFYTVTASSPYGANTFQLQARVTDVASNATGTSKSGEIRILWNDGYTDPARTAVGRPFAPDYDEYLPFDYVDGTLTANVSTRYATGLMAPDNSAFSITLPTVGIGSISAAYTVPSLETLSPPSLWFNGLATYMTAYLSEYRNPGFTFYSLDGRDYLSQNTNFDEMIISGYISNGSTTDVNTGMFNSGGASAGGGNYTFPIYSDGATFTTDYVRKTDMPTGRQGAVIRYRLGKDTAQTVDGNFVYRTAGYADPNILPGLDPTTWPGRGGPESRPLLAMGYRPGTNVFHGFQLIGDIGTNSSFGTPPTAWVYQGATVSDFTVYAWYRQSFGQRRTFTSGPTITFNYNTVCNLHITLGHPRWGSSVSSSSVGFWNSLSIQSNHMSILGTNLVSATMLLSKSYPNEISLADLTTVTNNWINRVKLYFNF